MMFYKEERLALFIDGANLHGASRALDFDVDFRRLFNLFARKGRLVRAFYYTTVIENQDYSPQRPLIDWLDYHSYTTVTKPLREYADSRDRIRVRSTIHVDLAIDMLEMADRVDHIVLVAGDGDLRRLVAAIQRKGCASPSSQRCSRAPHGLGRVAAPGRWFRRDHGPRPRNPAAAFE